jgi:hypothetical protein
MIALSFNKLLKRSCSRVSHGTLTLKLVYDLVIAVRKCRSLAFLVLPAELLSRTAY